MIRNASITPMCSSSPTDSTTSNACGDSPVNRWPSPIDAHAPDV